MKVILTQDVKGLGKKMDVKDVADGYALHFLIPKKLAAPADEKHLAAKGQWESSQNQANTQYEAMADKLKNLVLEFQVKTGAKGEIFSSITEKDIEKSLTAKGFKDFKIKLEKHLKTLGEHQVEVVFGKGIKAITVIKLSSY